MSFKVANIITAFNSESGGPPRTVAQIAAAGRGLWEADLFTTDFLESKSDVLLIREFPGHVHLYPAGARTLLGGLARLLRFNRNFETQLLRGVAPDVVHIHGLWSPYLAAFALTARRHRIPYIVAPHGMLEPWSLDVHAARKRFALKAYQGWVLENAAAIHATSGPEAQNLRRLGFRNTPIFVVPNTVDEPKPWQGGSRNSATGGALGAGGGLGTGGRLGTGGAAGGESTPLGAGTLPVRERVLLFLSRVHPKKGLEMLLAAWNELRPSHWRLLIVGSGERHYLNQLADYCKTHGVPNVDFRPHTEAEARENLFRSASAFVLPTYSENFGNVVAEALIRGLPVITTTGTPWSGLREHGCGWYIEPELEDLKRAIREVTSADCGTLAAMGEKGRRYARAHFTNPAVRESLLRMYHSALN
jgi:glycosyltransferase involved in cell wall biosynthesis